MALPTIHTYGSQQQNSAPPPGFDLTRDAGTAGVMASISCDASAAFDGASYGGVQMPEIAHYTDGSRHVYVLWLDDFSSCVGDALVGTGATGSYSAYMFGATIDSASPITVMSDGYGDGTDAVTLGESGKEGISFVHGVARGMNPVWLSGHTIYVDSRHLLNYYTDIGSKPLDEVDAAVGFSANINVVAGLAIMVEKIPHIYGEPIGIEVGLNAGTIVASGPVDIYGTRLKDGISIGLNPGAIKMTAKRQVPFVGEGIATSEMSEDGDEGQVLTQHDGRPPTWEDAGVGSLGMDDLSDADTTTDPPDTDDVLTWDGANWVPAVGGGGASSMDDLSDADTTTVAPTTDDVLTWDGANWVPDTSGSSDVAVMDDLTDADTTTVAPTTDDVLTWDGANWVPAVPPTPSLALDDLTDVDAAAPSHGEHLVYDAAQYLVSDTESDENDVDATAISGYDGAGSPVMGAGGNSRWNYQGWMRFDYTTPVRHSKARLYFYSAYNQWAYQVVIEASDSTDGPWDLALTYNVPGHNTWYEPEFTDLSINRRYWRIRLTSCHGNDDGWMMIENFWLTDVVASWVPTPPDVTTDPAWAAKGDLIVGTGDDTAAIRTVGADDEVLTADAAEADGVKWAAPAAAPGEGTSFPGSPATDERYYRTDHGLWFRYDGTRWSSEQLFRQPMPTNAVPSYSTQSNPSRLAFDDGFDIYLVAWHLTARIGTTNDGSNNWEIALLTQPDGTTQDSMDTSGWSPDTFTRYDAALDTVLDTDAAGDTTRLIQTRVKYNAGTPGDMNMFSSTLDHRIIAT